MMYVHTSFRVVKTDTVSFGAEDISGGAGTGRLSSSNPPLHQIKKDDLFRKCIAAPSGFYFLELDYSQGEPVCLAVLSGCKVWQSLFHKGIDLYRGIAGLLTNRAGSRSKIISTDELLNKDPEWVNAYLEKHVNKALRNAYKQRVLAKQYLESVESFALRAGLPIEEAEQFYREWDGLFPEIASWQQAIIQAVRDGEKICTPFGRTRTFQFRGGTSMEVFRQAVNFPVQSLLSDICLWKLCDLVDWIDAESLQDDIRVVNVVHDSWWLILREGLPAELVSTIQCIMQDMSTLPFPFPVPLRTSVKRGKDLGSVEEVGL